MVKGGQPIERTVSATDFAELSGVSRERLRTWERRHGFPEPMRRPGGRRRYRVEDVARVVAIREAVDDGVPVSDAIAAARAHDGAQADPDMSLGALADRLPLPMVVMSGPQPLRVEFVNPPLAGSLDRGDLLVERVPGFEASEGHKALLALFASDDGPMPCEHPPLDAPVGDPVRSVAFRLPVPAGQPPLACLVVIEGPDVRSQRAKIVQLAGELDSMQLQLDTNSSALDAVAALARSFRVEANAGSVVRAATDALAERLGARDAAVAVYMTGELVLGSSSRGEVGPAMVPLGGYPDLQRLLHGERPAWLEDGARGAFGIDNGYAVWGMPVAIAGDVVGLLIGVFDERIEFSTDRQRFAETMVAMVGFALLRDRFVERATEEAGR